MICNNLARLRNKKTEILNSFVYDHSNGFLKESIIPPKFLNEMDMAIETSSDLELLAHQYKGIGVHIG
jgi:hypothetical protein